MARKEFIKLLESNILILDKLSDKLKKIRWFCLVIRANN